MGLLRFCQEHFEADAVVWNASGPDLRLMHLLRSCCSSPHLSGNTEKESEDPPVEIILWAHAKTKVFTLEWRYGRALNRTSTAKVKGHWKAVLAKIRGISRLTRQSRSQCEISNATLPLVMVNNRGSLSM